MTINAKYSYGDFTGQSFTDVDAAEFNDTEIVGSCFWQELYPDSHVFPEGMVGVTFRRCNLDNVYIPPGNTVITEEGHPDYCCTKRIKPFPPTPKAEKKADDPPEGAIDWIVDADHKPVEPMDKRRFEEEGRSLSPADIPDDHEIEVTLTAAEYAQITKGQWEAGTAKGNKPLREKFAWFKEEPQVVKSETKVMEVAMPTETWLKTRAKGAFGMFDSEPENITVPLKDKPGMTRLRGPVTFKTVKGTAWLYRGETQADVDDRKRKLADVRKAVK